MPKQKMYIVDIIMLSKSTQTNIHRDRLYFDEKGKIYIELILNIIKLTDVLYWMISTIWIFSFRLKWPPTAKILKNKDPKMDQKKVFMIKY